MKILIEKIALGKTTYQEKEMDLFFSPSLGDEETITLYPIKSIKVLEKLKNAKFIFSYRKTGVSRKWFKEQTIKEYQQIIPIKKKAHIVDNTITIDNEQHSFIQSSRSNWYVKITDKVIQINELWGLLGGSAQHIEQENNKINLFETKTGISQREISYNGVHSETRYEITLVTRHKKSLLISNDRQELENRLDYSEYDGFRHEESHRVKNKRKSFVLFFFWDKKPKLEGQMIKPVKSGFKKVLVYTQKAFCLPKTPFEHVKLIQYCKKNGIPFKQI
jgi:hypothetical protein